ncbi:MAG: transglutaminaseTgpA domain-containing protein [Anaerolineae bacterium]
MKRLGFFVFVILFIMMFSVAGSIVTADWMPGLHVILLPAILGLVAGTALARSNFPDWTAHLTSAIYGTFLIGIIGATHSSINQKLEWRDRVLTLAGKISSWLGAAFSNGTSRETVIFILILAALFWLLGYTAAWYSFRYRRIWHVILPAGVTLFSNIYYYGGDAQMGIYLILFLICMLVLLVESHIADREEQWSREHVRFGGGLRWRATLAGFGVAAIALFGAFEVPQLMQSPSAQDFFAQANVPYSETLARFNRLFSNLKNYNLRPIDNYLSSVTLGGPRTLSDELAMTVIAPTGYRYYWRAASYDTYDGANWTNAPKQQVELKAGDGLPSQAQYVRRRDVQIQVALQRGTDAVYSPSVPKKAEVPSQGLTENAGTELVQLKVPAPLLPGNKFAATGSVSIASAEDLKTSRSAYPAWITRQYLQVPAAVPQRVRLLARNVAAQFNTPYERAKAIEAYLRQNIIYDETLEAPPPNVEASDYILYTTHRAYCTYYATAMVMMLRSLGVPSRIATGYAVGDMDLVAPDSPTADYTVRIRDSHVWVEVWFPEYGWVEFEPTAAQPEVDRTALAAIANPPTPVPLPTTDPAELERQLQERENRADLEPPDTTRSSDLSVQLMNFWNSIKNVLPFVLLFGLIGGLAVFGLRFVEGAGFAKLPPVQKAYGMLSRWASWMGIGENVTPYEQAEKLAQRAPRAKDGAQTITQAYVQERFGRQQRDSANDSIEMNYAWQAARKELRKAFISARLGLLKFARRK